MKISIKRNFSYYLILQVILVVVSLVMYTSCNPYSTNVKLAFELLFLITIIQSVIIYSLIHKSWLNIDNLFIAFFVFFLGSRVVFDLCSDEYPIEHFRFFLQRDVSINIVTRTLLNYIIAVCSFNIGSILWKSVNHFDSYTDNISILPHLKAPKSVIYILLLIGFVFKLYYSYQMFVQIQSKGYLAYFLGEISVNTNIIMGLLECCYIIALFILFSTEKKLSLFTIIAFIVYVILSMATGQRGPALLTLVFSIFYLNKLGHITLKTYHVVIGVISLCFVSIVMSAVRGGKDVEIDSVITALLEFVYGQSVSMTVLVSTIDYYDQLEYSFFDLFAQIRYLVDYYWHKLVSKPSFEINTLTLYEEYYKFYGQYISGIVNPSMLKEGYGLGSSYLAQFYAVGKEWFQLFGGIIIGYLYNILYRLLHSYKVFTRLCAFIILIIYIYIPRTNIMDPITSQWQTFVMAIFLYVVYNMYVKLNRY